MAIVLVYSEDPVVRDQVKLAIGRSPAPGVDDLSYLMCDEGEEVIRAVDEGLPDLVVLDGEAWPTGGLGLSREIKNSVDSPPPVIVLIGRPDDRFLGTWSQADVVLAHPIDAAALTAAAVRLLVERVKIGTAPGGADDRGRA